MLADLITLVRVPVIVALAIVISPQDPDLALCLYALGLVSHATDGIVAKYMHLDPARDRGRWHDWDTAYLSLGLQLAAILWLCRADVLDLGLPALFEAVLLLGGYFVIVGAIELRYVEPRKKTGREFIPVILVGSAVVWITLAALIAHQGSLAPLTAVAGVLLIGVVHLLARGELWWSWYEECQGRSTAK
jgi:hypothetical protein